MMHELSGGSRDQISMVTESRIGNKPNPRNALKAWSLNGLKVGARLARRPPASAAWALAAGLP